MRKQVGEKSSRSSLPIVIFVFFLVLPTLVSSISPKIDRINRDVPANDPAVLAALRDFYHALGGPCWTQQACWNSSSDGCSHYCLDWYGISCEFGKVTTIDLSRNNLNGTLPTSLASISSLVSLKLNNNFIKGKIPTIIGNLQNLTQLELANNSLSLSIPESIGTTKLKFLGLSRNALTGPLPDGLFNLPLEHLDLGQNRIESSIPPEMGQLTSLRYLDLSKNAFYGSLPITLSKLVNLQELVLHNNQLSGGIHKEAISSLKSLRKILLGTNNFNGSMHAIADLDSLQIAALNANQFSGEIIPSIGRLMSLSTLDLSDNQLIGSLPMEALREMFVDGSLTFFNIYGNTKMRSPTATPPAWLYEDPGVVDLEGTFKCNTLVATDRSTMILRVDPTYYNYWNCYCATGFYGTPPFSCMPCPENALCVGSVITYPSGFFPVWDFNSRFNASALRLQQCPQDAMSEMTNQSVCNPQGNVTISYANPKRGYTFDEDDLCAAGRTGFMCTRCDCDLNDTNADGTPKSCFYRRGNACALCAGTYSPQQSLLFAILFPTSLCIVLALGFMLFQGTLNCCSSSKRLPQSKYVDQRKSMPSFVSPPASRDASSAGLSMGNSNISSDKTNPAGAAAGAKVTTPTIGGHIKILIMWIQTLAKIISWPQVWAVSTIAAVLDIFNLQMLPLGFFCLLPTLTHELWNVVFYMLTPVGLIVIVGVALSIASLGDFISSKASKTFIEEDYVNDELLALPGGNLVQPQWKPTLLHRIARWILVVLYFAYFGLSVEALSLLNCSLRGGVGLRFLESRPFIACGSLEWWPLQTVATVAIPTYTVGVFILFCVLFIAFRNRMREAASTKNSEDHVIKHILGFLFESYTPEMWWYEIVVFFRRLLLALVIGIVPSSSVFKAFCSFVVLLLSLLIQNWLQPYRTSIENRTEELGLVMLIGTFAAQFFATTSYGTPVEHSDILFVMLLCFDGIFLMFMLVGLIRACIARFKCCARRTTKGYRQRAAREYRGRPTRAGDPNM